MTEFIENRRPFEFHSQMIKCKLCNNLSNNFVYIEERKKDRWVCYSCAISNNYIENERKKDDR